LFGSVTAADIAEELSQVTGSVIDKKKIDIEKPLRQAGSHEVTSRLAGDIKPQITVVIEEEQRLGMAEDKAPPHDIEAEEAVIGSLLIDPDAILKVATSLKAEDFFSETNRIIYQACLSLYQRNEVINQITVAHELMRQNKLEQTGVPPS
jgi:hypothetical protein